MPDPNDLKNLSSQLKKTIIFAESFKGGSSVDPSKNILNIQKTTIGLAGHVLQLVSIVSDLAKIVNNNSKKITSLKNISKSQSSRISGKNIGAKLPGSSTSNVEDNISKITKSVISIAEILSGQKKLKDSSTSYDRRKAEQEKRSLAESKLEKRFDGLKKAAEKILAPVKSLLDKIINFLVTVFLGRVVYKLLEWFGDPKNADKVKSIGRFLGDHWPKLLALYLTFGTSFGRFALGLTKAVASGAIKLAFAIAKLLAAKKVKGAMGAARFLGGKGGKITAAVLGTAAAVTGAYALTQGMKGDDEEPKTLKPEEPKIPGYAGGGIIKIPAFKGGGFNFKGMFGGALGSSPEKPQEMPNGFVSGEKGVDKVPAMLSDGEFVMSVGAVQKYGVDTLEGMNAAGGGTNRPKMMGGKTYAEGGGLVGDIPLDSSVGRFGDDNAFRRYARIFSKDGKFGIEEDLFKSFKKLGGVPDFQKMVGGPENMLKISQGLYGDDALDDIRKSVVEKLKGVNNLKSSTKIGSALDNTTSALDDAIKSNKRGLRDTGFKLGSRIAPEHRMLPAAGQSSANMMKAVRAPIPASRAIVPYAGGGALARQGGGGLATKPLQQIGTNMNVSPGRAAGFIKGAKTLGLELLLQYFLDKGMNYLDAKRIADTVDKASKAPAEKRDAYIESVRKDLDKEKRHQKSLGGIFDKIIAMGGETQSEYISKNREALLTALGSKPYEGGAIKGGFGLKDQSFKDAPKTQIMTDDKGRPFIGYKSMKNGKLHYSRGSQPGTGTSNPFEAFGRAINPGAYKDNDAKLAMQNQRVAETNSLESLQARGASVDAQGRMMKQIGANSKQTQNDLTYRKNEQKKWANQLLMPTTKPKVNVIFGEIPKKSSFNLKSSSGASPKIPSISSTHPKSEHRRQILAILGVK